MRVTNNLIYGQSSQAISKANDRYMDINKKISEQTSIVKPSDNPVGTGQVLQYENSSSQLKQYDGNMKMAKSHLEYEEVALDSLNGFLDDARTLFIQAENTANTQDDLNAITEQISKMVDSMADLMNSKSADGSYIFAGTDISSPAFTLRPDGRYDWTGNEGQKFAQISENRKIPINDTGKQLFQDVWTRNNFTATLLAGNVSLSAKVHDEGDFDAFLSDNYSATSGVANNFVLTTTPLGAAADAQAEAQLPPEDGEKVPFYSGPPGEYSLMDSTGNLVASGVYEPNQPLIINGMSFVIKGAPGAAIEVSLNPPKRDNVLNQLKDAIAVLRDKNATSDEKDAALHDAQVSVVNTQASIGEGRSSVGARLNTLSERGDFSSANQLSNIMAQDRVAGLDMGAAATELSMAESALTSSQKLFSRVSNLSLFNKI
ncbi:flagellar hook-associated protein FlgL [Marinomonas pollencensis]|uniref:Flagellar hook-associated protein 3 FlgL n=1 Tax=Marinomonas pollencensis TaxID=491954 RepID=A0A3E0DR90_9GAMM|nr:flagellar hook-associated protein FlgL [Marinomonas pollencensis]REG84852.1 flagellar hook-associated protein 3 FlgL [Marinomonas pollencensis]